jgi:hypothetical protein
MVIIYGCPIENDINPVLDLINNMEIIKLPFLK